MLLGSMAQTKGAYAIRRCRQHGFWHENTEETLTTEPAMMLQPVLQAERGLRLPGADTIILLKADG